MEEQPDNIIPEEGSAFIRFLKAHKAIRVVLICISILLLLIFLISVPVYIAPSLQHTWGNNRAECRIDSTLLKDKAIKKQISRLQGDITRLDRKLAGFIPTQTYMVINTTDNRFVLYKSHKLVREGFCSSGSYTLLKTEDGEKEWIFKTPKGRFTIHGKTTDPVWRKPDWAFVEEGLPIPGEGDPSRWEYGVLGDYALSLGDGYLIHGTIYKRFLGMPVTHGCIRLNDDDLKAVYNALNIGSKVYIY